MRPQGTFSGPFVGGGYTPAPFGPRKRTGTYRSAWLGSRYLAGRSVMPPEIVAALQGYPERGSYMGMGDDGYGNHYLSDDSGLSGIFGSIKKAVSGAAKGVAKAVGGVAKVAGKGVVLAAKNVGRLAPVVGLIPGVGTVAGLAIGAGSKFVSGIANKKSVGDVFLDTVSGGAQGAASGFANKKLLGGKGVVGLGQKVGGLFKKKGTPEQREQADREKMASDAAKRDRKAQQDADKAQAKIERKKAALAAKEIRDTRTTQDADKSELDTSKQQEIFDNLTRKTQEIISQATAGSGGGGGGGGSPFGGGAATAVAPEATQVQEAGMMAGLPSWAMPALALGLVMAMSKGAPTRARSRR